MQTQATRKGQTETYFPSPESQGGWRALITPSQEPTSTQKKTILQTTGLDWDKLAEVWAYCQSYPSPHAVLVIRHGWIAGEWYDSSGMEDGIASCTKSLTGLAFARLFDLSDAGRLHKRIGMDDEAWRFLLDAWVKPKPLFYHGFWTRLMTALTDWQGEGNRLV